MVLPSGKLKLLNPFYPTGEPTLLYLGIDPHARQITISLRDDNGDVLQARQVSTEPKKVNVFFQQLTRERLQKGESFVAVLEVCGPTRVGPNGRDLKLQTSSGVLHRKMSICNVCFNDRRSSSGRVAPALFAPNIQRTYFPP
jgi:hypothetical protein